MFLKNQQITMAITKVFTSPGMPLKAGVIQLFPEIKIFSRSCEFKKEFDLG